MKHLLLILLCSLAFAALCALAQDVTPVTTTAITPDALTGFLEGMVTKWPWLSTVLMVVGVLRLAFKPIMTAIESVVKATPSEADDAYLLKAAASPAWKWFCWLLNYTASVKIGTEKK